MTSARFAAFIALVLSLCPSWLHQAEAYQSYVHDESEIRATYLTVKDVCIAPGAWVEFHTDNLSSSAADPVMHILRSVNGEYEQLYFDDDSHDGVNPSISFVAASGGTQCKNYRILVRAYSNQGGGAGGESYTMYLGQSPIGTYPLGGFVFIPSAPVGPTEIMEAVPVNEGASATVLYQFTNDGTMYVGRSFLDSGVGPGSPCVSVVAASVI